jgi:hypothetical protein
MLPWSSRGHGLRVQLAAESVALQSGIRGIA